jgi:recombination associated protein RdgC
MWFKNLQIYRLPKNWVSNAGKLEEQLSALTLPPCSAGDSRSIGWVSPCAAGTLVHAVNRQWLLALGIEEKLLPASVVRQFADARATAIEENDGRRVGRKEMREALGGEVVSES